MRILFREYGSLSFLLWQASLTHPGLTKPELTPTSKTRHDPTRSGLIRPDPTQNNTTQFTVTLAKMCSAISQKWPHFWELKNVYRNSKLLDAWVLISKTPNPMMFYHFLYKKGLKSSIKFVSYQFTIKWSYVTAYGSDEQKKKCAKTIDFIEISGSNWSRHKSLNNGLAQLWLG